MKTHKKLIALAMVCSMCTPMSVSATTTETADVTTPTEEACSVSASKESTWTVTIPKSVTLAVEGVSASADYEVSVRGSIDTTHSIFVKPDSGFDMTCNDVSLPATVTQEVTQFSGGNFTADTPSVVTGSITVEKIKVGEYNGSFDFHVSYLDHVHNYVDGVCTECGGVDLGHEHVYTETVIKEPTCTEGGKKQLVCVCGDSKKVIIPATGHQYNDGTCTECGRLDSEHEHSYTETITQAPTCTEEGKKILTCLCGDSFEETVPATGHTYVDEVTTSGSCEVDRIVTHTCWCGDTYTENKGKRHSFNAKGFCSSCMSANMDLYPEPGLYGIADGKPVFRTPWSTLAGLSGSSISAETWSYKNTMLYACCQSVANPYGEYFIVCLPDQVTKIGANQFNSFGNISTSERLYGVIGNNVTVIGEQAFYSGGSGESDCDYFAFPNLRSVGQRAFDGENYISSLHLPSSVTSIGINAFGQVDYLYYKGSATGSPWGASHHSKY